MWLYRLGHENFQLLNHDVILPLVIEVDQIYHLASPASPVKYMYNPVKTIKTNTIGTLNMLGLAKRVRARFLMASTSEVYGDPTVHPQHEEYWGNVNPIGPRACYDEGKRVAETIVYAYANQVRDCKILREAILFVELLLSSPPPPPLFPRITWMWGLHEYSTPMAPGCTCLMVRFPSPLKKKKFFSIPIMCGQCLYFCTT